ncbi:hypothetical protein ACUN7V_02445 [Quadrisphaera oryzae]|uniref:hypothetical protein n=1 Tax=Quadrisphaera oryzae TaxID=2509661 RepID=UPI00199EAA85|nr:hypothetical protein [Quadrisphaera sp. RL12-1S]
MTPTSVPAPEDSLIAAALQRLLASAPPPLSPAREAALRRALGPAAQTILTATAVPAAAA